MSLRYSRGGSVYAVAPLWYRQARIAGYAATNSTIEAMPYATVTEKINTTRPRPKFLATPILSR